jgi:hypothetical protein
MLPSDQDSGGSLTHPDGVTLNWLRRRRTIESGLVCALATGLWLSLVRHDWASVCGAGRGTSLESSAQHVAVDFREPGGSDLNAEARNHVGVKRAPVKLRA